MPLSAFHPVVARWFEQKFGEPTPPQRLGWEAIRQGRDTLIAAPTGSGKTLAAFLEELDRLFREGLEAPLPDETRVVYVSPLKALSADIHLNLAEPRREIRKLAEEMGFEAPRITAAIRSGDTPAERAGGHASEAAAHPGHHPRVALPHAHRPTQPGDAAHRPHRHRRRDPRGAGIPPGGPPGAEPGAAGPRGPAAGAADRPLGDDGADRGRRDSWLVGSGDPDAPTAPPPR